MSSGIARQPSSRISSVDLLRGLACALMAIDHVRVYSGLPAGGPTAGIFFTRWITHFVAPAFCFLAGTGAFLHGRKLGDINALTRYLVSRGAVLVLLELSVIRVFWTFNLDFAHYILFGVIWMLGICMILMGGLVRLSTRAIGIFGMVVIFAQQLVGLVATIPESARDGPGWLFQFVWYGGRITLGTDGPTLAILYSIVPWIGVMAAGYAFGTVLLRDAADRRRMCIAAKSTSRRARDSPHHHPGLPPQLRRERGDARARPGRVDHRQFVRGHQRSRPPDPPGDPPRPPRFSRRPDHRHRLRGGTGPARLRGDARSGAGGGQCGQICGGVVCP